MPRLGISIKKSIKTGSRLVVIQGLQGVYEGLWGDRGDGVSFWVIKMS